MPDFSSAERDLDQALEDLRQCAKDRATALLKASPAHAEPTDENVMAKAIDLLQTAATDMRLALAGRQTARREQGR